MKFTHFLPLLFLSFLFNACIDKTITRTVQSTTPPEFSTDRENLKNKIMEIIPADNIVITSGSTITSGEEEYNFLTVEVVNPESFPSGGFAFSDMANEISEVVKEDISNIEDYQVMKIEVRNTVQENDTEHIRTFKKEIDI